jgi:hypothetical protein
VIVGLYCNAQTFATVISLTLALPNDRLKRAQPVKRRFIRFFGFLLCVISWVSLLVGHFEVLSPCNSIPYQYVHTLDHAPQLLQRNPTRALGVVGLILYLVN